MVRSISIVALVALLAAPSVSAVRAVEDQNANPIRKVVTLLQTMAKKVEKEGDKEKELYEKFMCYCKTGGSDLTQAIGDSQAQVPAIQSDIEESTSNSAKLKQDLKRHAVDRNAANSAMAEATALREKEVAAFTAESTELQGYVTSMNGAIPAIEAGMAGTGLLQSQAAQVAMLRRAIGKDESLTDYDRESVLAFLAGSTQGTSSRYVPKGGEIVGILKDMRDGFSKDLSAVKKTETDAVKVFDQLMSAKKKEVSTLTASIEKKTARVGELDLSIVRMKQELTDGEEALIENQKFLKDLDQDCKTKSGEMDARVKTRNEELIAIHDTIKILNDDDALELFKKTLPGASSALVQVDSKSNEAVRKAMLVLRKGEQNTEKDSGADLRFLELALMGRKVDFSKVLKMIDDMVVILKQEQVDDDAKVEYCNMQLDNTKDKAKGLTKSIQDIEVDVDEKTNTISTLKDDLKALNKGIAELDRLVADATQQRKEENEEFTQLISNDMAAKELLAFAKNRLQKFYNPKQYKAPKTGEADTEFIQIISKQDPGAPPPTFEKGYKKSGEESGGVVGMIDLLVRDLDKEMTQAETQEELGQKAYEGLMNDSAEKRAKDVKSVQVKESGKADNEEMKTAAEGDLKGKKSEFMAVEQYITQLHAECDWLLQNFDLRKSARAEEMDALKSAKAVLSGANFSLLQATKALRGRSL
jgi:septal ring factor EnvC (AmiA/AmiB activator)